MPRLASRSANACATMPASPLRPRARSALQTAPEKNIDDIRHHCLMIFVIEVNERSRTAAMRLTKEKVAENKARVVETAARLFREKGFEGVGVADLMNAAGLTHGGFYNHFESKGELATQACE